MLASMAEREESQTKFKSEEFTMRMEEVLHELPRIDQKLTILPLQSESNNKDLYKQKVICTFVVERTD